jgi:hypothetical protein
MIKRARWWCTAVNTYIYDSDGFKKVENVSGNLSTIIWDGTDSL